MRNKCSKLSVFKYYIIYCVRLNCASNKDGLDPADGDVVDNGANSNSSGRQVANCHLPAFDIQLCSECGQDSVLLSAE